MDWNKLILPQSDNYDSINLKKLARERYGEPKVSEDTFSYGGLPSSVGGNFEGVSDHENIPEIEKHLQLWPEAWVGYNILIDKVCPLESIPKQRPAPAGSTSGHFIDKKDGTLGVYVTFGHVAGAVAGLWHEYGHLRLHALDIRLETYPEQFFLNHPDSRYVSAIRKDQLRPISACLHGLYAWVLLSEGHMRFETEEVRPFFDTNIFKLQEGLESFRAHAKLTPDGEQLLNPLTEFTEDLIERIWNKIGRDGEEKSRARHDKWKDSSEVTSDNMYAEEAKS